MDLVTDQINKLVSTFDSLKGNILIVHGAKSLLGSIQPLIESSNKLSSISTSIVGGTDSSLIAKKSENLRKDSSNKTGAEKYGFEADAKGRVTFKVIQKAGFYPMIDAPDAMLDVLSSWYADLK